MQVVPTFQDNITTACGFCSGLPYSSENTKFSVIQEHVQNHIYNGHLVLPWMSKPQLHFDFQMHFPPLWPKQMYEACLRGHKTGPCGQQNLR